MARNPYATWTKQPKKDRVIVSGVPEIDKKLKKLSFTVQKKLLRKAMKSGMRLILAEAKSACRCSRA